MRRAERWLLSFVSASALLAAGLTGCSGNIGPDQSGDGTGGDGTGGGAGSAVPNPVPGGDVGTVDIHLLSNTEYNNTVRDLLGTALRPGDKFQTDEAAG